MKKSHQHVKPKKISSHEKQKILSKSPTHPKSEKISKRNVVGKEIVDDVGRNKIMKVYCSRCSPTNFKNAMEELKPKLGEKQRIRIKATPFGNWIDMPELAISSRRIDFILNTFEINSCSLIVGDDIKIPFTSTEFSIILGLHNIGQPVDLDLKMKSLFVDRQFEGQVGNAKRAKIYEKLISLACSDNELEIDDFVRLYILFIFNCIIFPTGNYYTPSFIFPYLDDLTIFFDYAWGDAAFRYLYRAILNIESRSYLDGCTVGLMAWVYERVPSLAVRSSLKMFPRLFRWIDSKIPLKDVKAESLLKSIDSTKILSIYPFDEERKLVERTESDIESSKVEKIVKKKMDEIKKQLFIELKHCGKKMMVVDKDVGEFGADFHLNSPNDFGAMIEKADNDVDFTFNDIVSDILKEKTEMDNLHDKDKEINEAIGTDLSDIDALLLNVVTEIEKENNDVVVSDKENHDLGNVGDSKGVNCDRKSDVVKENKNFEYDKEKNDVLCSENVSETAENSKGVSTDATCDAVKENNDAVRSENDSETGDDSKCVSSSATSAVLKENIVVIGSEHIPAIQSSIVETVRTRVDRKKKRKASMFVTPPSSTPRLKRRVKKQEKSIFYIDDNSKSPVVEDLHVYKDRPDYCGHEEATHEERSLLTNYLSREALNVNIWADDTVILEGKKFCEFVFGEPVDFEIINVYMRIMQKKSKENGFEIYCMDTTVQREVFFQLKKKDNRRKLQSDDDHGAFVSSLTSATRGRLQMLNEELFARCKYIIFPMNHRWHWFLLVYRTSDNSFRLWNSLRDPRANGTAKIYVSFLVRCIRSQSGFVLGSEEVVREVCRDQGNSHDCGVYTCMWVECFARDTDEMWEFQKDVNMEAYRARVAASILSDENGLLANITVV